MAQTFKVVLGGGESGVGAALLAKAKGFKVFVSDSGKIADNYKQILQENNIVFEEGKHTENVILMADEVIKSPGIPEKAPIIRSLRDEGIRVISEIEFAARYTKGKIIGITGTNGKTTTTLFTYHLLKSAGLNVGIAGNIGDSFARQVVEDKHDYYVLEISSFQLDDAYELKPYIAILLNITPDHLDRYNYDLQQYVDAKFRLIQNMEEGDTIIYYEENELIMREIELEQPFAALKPINNSFFPDNRIKLPASLINPEAGEEQNIVFDKLPLPGMHNQINMSAAIITALLLGVSKAQIEQAFNSFVNAPHRLEKVAEIKGVTFINDSKATNVDSVFYALGSFDSPLVWIAGGQDKGNDYQQIEMLVKKRVKALVCLGKDNSKINNYFQGKVAQIVQTDKISAAVREAFRLAKPGDTVLLSPACASFDLFKNYEDRGEQFRKACEQLKAEVEK